MNPPTLFPMLMLIMMSAIGYVSSSVVCGAHTAPDCSQCPQGHGASYCHGDCEWKSAKCVKKADCSCNAYMSKSGYGQCKKALAGPTFGGAKICYVNAPSNCADFAKTPNGELLSAEACIGSKYSTESEALEAINKFRANHRVPPLRISATLNRYAREWATALAKGTKSGHGGCNGCGQNIWYGGAKSIKEKQYQITAIIHSFYNVESYRYYDQKNNPGPTGHFTALIWKATTEMGVADVTVNDRRIVVINFNPPGNVPGGFRDNILPPKVCKFIPHHVYCKTEGLPA